MSEQFTKEKLAKIGQYILEGMSEDEASILTDTKVETLKEHKEANEKIRDYIEKCKVTFKYNHIKEMQTVKGGKTSQWLLERLRPEDFNLSTKARGPSVVNVIGTIIQQIQGDDKNRLITRNRNDIIEIKQEEEQRDVIGLLN